MFRSILAAAAALALLVGAAPERAKASDRDVIYGVLIGAAAGGIIAVIADDDNKDRRRSERYDRRRDVHYDRRHDRHGDYRHSHSDRRYERRGHSGDRGRGHYISNGRGHDDGGRGRLVAVEKRYYEKSNRRERGGDRHERRGR